MPTTITGTPTTTNTLVVPSDGDRRNAASVVPAFQALLNNDDWALARLTGATRLMFVGSFTPVAGSGWGALTAYSGTIGTGPIYQGTASSISAVAGDIVEVSMSLSMQWNYGGSGGGLGLSTLRVEYQDNYTGTGATVADTGSQSDLNVNVPSTTLLLPGISLLSAHTVVTGGPLGILVNGKVTNAQSAADWKITAGNIVARLWRAN